MTGRSMKELFATSYPQDSQKHLRQPKSFLYALGLAYAIIQEQFAQEGQGAS